MPQSIKLETSDITKLVTILEQYSGEGNAISHSELIDLRKHVRAVNVKPDSHQIAPRTSGKHISIANKRQYEMLKDALAWARRHMTPPESLVAGKIVRKIEDDD